MAYEYIFGIFACFLGLVLFYYNIRTNKTEAAAASMVVSARNGEVTEGTATDIIIVGAGVAGAALAYTLGKVLASLISPLRHLFHHLVTCF